MSICARTAVAVCAALAVPSGALAAYAPRLVVTSGTHALGAAAPLKLSLGQLSTSDQALARVTIYTPRGYTPALKQAPGTVVGTARAGMKPRTAGATLVSFAGALTADDPAKYASNTCAPGVHEAVWLLALAYARETLTLPLYVDSIKTGVESGFASAKIETCLPSPDVPEGAGGAPGGRALTSLTLSIGSVFTNPTTRGEYRWSAFFTPFFTGTANTNLMATQEARALVRLPVELTLAGARVKKQKDLRISGSLHEGGRIVPGATIRIFAGASPQHLELVRVLHTGARGGYRAIIRVRGKQTYFRARAIIAARTATQYGCFGPSLAPSGCTAATLQPLSLASVTLSSRVTTASAGRRAGRRQ